MSVYWLIVLLTIVLGIVMPQNGGKRKYYIIIITVIHTFVCAFRYKFLTGDLIKYNTTFRHLAKQRYFDESVVHGWRNTGFYWTMKFIGGLTDYDYQTFLIILASFFCIVTGWFIYRYSTKPWLSFLVWDCMVFYLLYGFLAIKQGLAMTVLLFAMACIFEKKPFLFFVMSLIAGFIHFPAFCFLPAYFLANRKVDYRLVSLYFILAVIIFFFRTRIVDYISDLYYEEENFQLVKSGIGGRVLVIVLILFTGLCLKGFKEKRFCQLFNILVAAAIIQTFSGFDNVFTRLADYYLQYSILFIPSIFYFDNGTRIDQHATSAMISFNERSIRLLVMVLICVLIWWYYTTCLGTTITNEVDNFLNFRFMWEVH